jgi:hypothetical protein
MRSEVLVIEFYTYPGLASTSEKERETKPKEELNGR